MNETVIIGAGLAGLGAALRLKKRGIACTIFEKEKRIGGLCRTEKKDGFYFDYTGHLLHFRNDVFKSLVFSLIGHNLESRKRSAWIFSKDVYTKYPFQANLYGLPNDVIIECIYEYSRRFFNPYTSVIQNFGDWIDEYLGSGIAKHFMIPYNTKIYRRDLSELSPDCIGRFVPQSDLKLLLRGALSGGDENLGYNSLFFYPQRGGIESLVQALAQNMCIHTDEKVVKIKINEKRIVSSRGRLIDYQKIISTQPINELIEMCIGDIDQIRSLASKLNYVSVLNINLGINGNISDKHWIYVPEDKFIFHRIGFNHNFSDYMSPTGFSSIYLEISYDPKKGIDHLWAIEKSIDDLIAMKVIESREQVVLLHSIDIPYAYVIFDHHRKSALQAVRKFLEQEGIYTAGRFGSWDYFSMEDAFMDGWNIAEQ